VMVSMDLALL